MKYNEYKSSNGKVLLNIENFTYGNTILSTKDLSAKLIEVDKSIAEEYSKKHQEQIDEYYRTKNSNNENDSIMTLDENGVYIENKEDDIDKITTFLVAEILTKYDTSKLITCIKHE